MPSIIHGGGGGGGNDELMTKYNVVATYKNSEEAYSGSYWTTKTYTYYWNEDKTDVDYSKSIILINGGIDNSSRNPLINSCEGVDTTPFIVNLGNTNHKMNLTSNGFQIVGTGNAGTSSPALSVQLITFKNCKSVQVVETTTLSSYEVLNVTGNNYASYACYFNIESVNPNKSMLFNCGCSVGHQTSTGANLPIPCIYDSTRVLWVVRMLTSPPTGVGQARFAVVEFE